LAASRTQVIPLQAYPLAQSAFDAQLVGQAPDVPLQT
jgi:hypothetical protein